MPDTPKAASEAIAATVTKLVAVDIEQAILTDIDPATQYERTWRGVARHVAAFHAQQLRALADSDEATKPGTPMWIAAWLRAEAARWEAGQG